MDEYGRGLLLIFTSAIAFGLMPIFARFAYNNEVGVYELLMVRFILAFITMGFILIKTGSGLSARKDEIMVLLALGGIGYFLQSSLYFLALLRTPVSVVALLLYTYPALVTASSAALGWERPSASLGLSLSLALIGLFLIVRPVSSIALTGALMALGAALTYTVYILISTRVLREMSGVKATFYVTGAASVSFTTYGFVTGNVHLAWTLEGWFWVALIAVVSTSIAATTFFQGLKVIGPSRASIVSLVEPIVSAVVASILFSESLDALQWMGGFFILLATAFVALSHRSTQGARA